MSENWTKGPWVVGYKDGSGKFGKYQGDYQSCVTHQNCLLATVWHHDKDDYPKDRPIMPAEANAHLIAAAPDMYKALEPFAEFACSPPGECDCHNCHARDVLAKARGE